MHWILQENIYSEQGWIKLVETLERFNIPYSTHKIVPFVGEIVPDANPVGPVMCMGSYSLRHLAQKRGWSPGVFDLEPFDFLQQLEHWDDQMLNYDSLVYRFKNADWVDAHEYMFIRPIHDSKSFSGAVFTKEEFYTWKRKVVVLEEQDGSTVNGDTVIQMCSPKKILGEYRYWIVNGEIVTKSQYKLGDRILHSSDVDNRFDDYVNRMVAIWQPLPAFVIDVCEVETPAGTEMKIVEINTLNAAGFYAGDTQLLVMKLEEVFNVN